MCKSILSTSPNCECWTPDLRTPRPETRQSTISGFGVQYNIYGYAQGGFKHIWHMSLSSHILSWVPGTQHSGLGGRASVKWLWIYRTIFMDVWQLHSNIFKKCFFISNIESRVPNPEIWVLGFGFQASAPSTQGLGFKGQWNVYGYMTTWFEHFWKMSFHLKFQLPSPEPWDPSPGSPQFWGLGINEMSMDSNIFASFWPWVISTVNLEFSVPDVGKVGQSFNCGIGNMHWQTFMYIYH
jgi:hypothetical protein